MATGRPTTGTRTEANIPTETLGPLDHIAETLDLTRADLIRRALEEWVNANGVSAIQVRTAADTWETVRHETITREEAEGADPGILARRLGAYDDKAGRSLMGVDPAEWRVDVSWLGAWTGAEMEERARQEEARRRRHPGPFSSGRVVRGRRGSGVTGQPKPAQEPLAGWERELLEGAPDA